MASRSKLPLILASIVFLGSGAALALMLRKPDQAIAPVEAPKAQRPTIADRLRLLNEAPMPEEALVGERYMDARWGHMDDPGSTFASADAEGRKYYIEPRMIRGWTPNGPNYATVIAEPHVMDPSQRIRRVPRDPERRIATDTYDPANFQKRIQELIEKSGGQSQSQATGQ